VSLENPPTTARGQSLCTFLLCLGLESSTFSTEYQTLIILNSLRLQIPAGLHRLYKPSTLNPKPDTEHSPTAGGYNFPLICADFVITRICIDPDDWKGGGLGQVREWVQGL
jgi:hypothetical protein